MTTQVTLTDEQNKALTKLGAKFTAKPLECTHLVAHKIVRTEKFLCAMAAAPHIVTEKWVAACVTKKSLQRAFVSLLTALSSRCIFSGGFVCSERL